MKIHSAEHTFYYIDPSLVSGGDGSSVATAAKDFPSSLTENTIYLIRRTTLTDLGDGSVYTTLPNGTHTIKSLVIMGMPKSTDKEYDLVPEDAKTAWGNDNYDFANVRIYKTSSGNQVQFSQCLNFKMSRTMLLVQQTSSWDDYYMYFHLSPNVAIDHCSFRYFNWIIKDATTHPDEYRSPTRYMTFRNNDRQENYYGYFFHMDDCIIEKSGYRHGFEGYGYHQIELTNLTIYADQTNGDNYAICFGQNYRGSILKIENITHLQHFSSADIGYWTNGSIYVSGANYAKISNVNASRGNLNSLEPYRNRVVVTPIINVSVLGSGMDVDNITVNYPFIRLLRSSLIRLEQAAYDYDDRVVPESSQYAKIKNISITTASDNSNVYSEEVGTSKNIFNNSGDCGALYLNCQDRYSSYLNVSNKFLVQGIQLNCKAGVALFAKHSIIDLSNTADVIYGCINLNSCTGKIKKIESWMPGYIIYDRGYNFLFIEEIVGNRNNPSYSYNADPALYTTWASNILCTKCNIKFAPEYYGDGGYADRNNDCNYVITSEVTEGNYVVRNRIAKAQTWSTNRQGSDTGCSLKLTNEVRDDSRFPLRLGGEPFQGIQVDIPTGKKTLKIYCTTYGYNNPSEIVNNHLLCKVTLPDGQVLFSNSGNWVEDTSSVWNDVDNNTSFVFELPINSNVEGTGYIEYFFNWYQKEAITYLDPFPIIS